MLSFDTWYEQNKEAILLLEKRKDVAFYVWTNKPNKIAKPSAKELGGYSKDFEQFWQEYPNRIGKGAAYVIWLKLKPPIIDCINTLAWQKQTQQWKNENGKYIPHPSTWLNQRRWEDESPAKPQGESGEWYIDINGIKRQKLSQ